MEKPLSQCYCDSMAVDVRVQQCRVWYQGPAVEVRDWYFLGPCHSFQQDGPARATISIYICFAQRIPSRNSPHTRSFMRGTLHWHCANTLVFLVQRHLCSIVNSIEDKPQETIKSRIVKLRPHSAGQSASVPIDTGTRQNGAGPRCRGNLFFHLLNHLGQLGRIGSVSGCTRPVAGGGPRGKLP